MFVVVAGSLRVLLPCVRVGGFRLRLSHAYANLDCWVALLSYFYFFFLLSLSFDFFFFSSPLCVCQECACAKSLIVHNQELDVTLPVPSVR